MEVRLLLEEDAEALWHLRLTALESEPQAFSERAAHHRTTPVTRYAEQLGSRSFDNPVFGAFDGKKLVGMAGWYPYGFDPRRAGRVWGMFVVPEYRGKGIARDLMKALLRHAGNVGGLDSLWLQVADTQVYARKLYLGCGFRPAGTAENGMEGMLLEFDRGHGACHDEKLKPD